MKTLLATLIIFSISKDVFADLRCKRFFLGQDQHRDLLALFHKAQELKPKYQYPRLSLQAKTIKNTDYLEVDMDVESVKKIKEYVDGLKVNSDELITFRGQANFTQKVQSYNRRVEGQDEAVMTQLQILQSQSFPIFLT